MFRGHAEEPVYNFRLVVSGLLAFSVAALGVTIWVMNDFLREQVIVAQLVKKLPPEALESAAELAGELRWQFRLSILVVLNLLATGFALALLSRAYLTSQESLRDFKALAGDILSSVDQAVITTDLRGNITSINRRGLEMFDCQNDIVGKSLEELAPSLELLQFRRDATEQGTARLMRDFRYQPLGKQRPVRRFRAFCDILRSHRDVEIGSIIQLRDVTERSLIEERMQRMERFLELGSLSVGLHHEIKNPLAALSLHVQLLEEELEERGTFGDAAETLSIVQQEVRRIGNVLESFRDFASLGKLHSCPTDIVELISRQVRFMVPKAERAGIHLSFTRPAEKIPALLIDSDKMEQVLLNLMLNGMEAMHEGGVLTVRVSLSRESSDAPTSPSGSTSQTVLTEQVIIEVQDNGPGIPSDLIGRIFDPYFTTKGDGTGMGLAICEKIVRQHEGSLEVTSSHDGTLFTISLPSSLCRH